MAGETLFDFAFQDELLALAVHDRKFLRDHADKLRVEDFAPAMEGAPIERWYLAGIALEFYRKHKAPVGRYLRVTVGEFIRDRSLHEKAAARLVEYTTKVIHMARQPVALSAITEKLAAYHSDKAKFDAINKLMDAMRAGNLTDDVWMQVTRAAVENHDNGIHAVDFFPGIEDRISRRKEIYRMRDYPFLFLDEFDGKSRSISYGHLGLIMAPYGRGKSLMFAHLGIAYAVQGLNVLHFTLEDRLPDVEDRLDAAITRVPVKELGENAERVRGNFAYAKRMIRSRLQIIDGTDGGMTVQKMEAIYEKYRDEGFFADVVLVDYDDELHPAQKRNKRYEEFDEIYRDFRAFISRAQVIGWIASQTGRGTETVKVIRGDKIAQDMGKIRKAHLAISLGEGEWGEDSCYVWIEKHRGDRQRWGFNIIQDRSRMLFYDREHTLERMAGAQQDKALMQDAERRAS